MSKKPCVLVAEDDPDFRAFMASRIETLGCNVVAVADGIEAMKYLSDTFSAVTSDPAPDLLITDIRMPHCEGVDVLAYTRLRPLPTIIVTAFGSPETFDEVRELGAVECFSKPFDIDELCTAVRRHLPDDAAVRR